MKHKMNVVGVYRTKDRADAAVTALQEAGVDPAVLRVNDPRDRLSAVEAEMRSETINLIVGPGRVRAWTIEMAEGSLLGIVALGIVGLVLALPFAAIGFGSMVWWTRLVMVAVVGATAGATVGLLIGASFAAKRPEEPLAAEAGFTVGAPLSPTVHEVLLRSDAVRVDLVAADGHPLTVLDEHEPAIDELLHDIERHMHDEDRRG